MTAGYYQEKEIPEGHVKLKEKFLPVKFELSDVEKTSIFISPKLTV